MKRKSSQRDHTLKRAKMTRMEIAADLNNSLEVVSGSDVSEVLVKHFNYKMSDRKAKANILKAAARDTFEVAEMQKCTMITFNVASYLHIVL